MKENKKKAREALKFSILETIDIAELERRVEEMNRCTRIWGIDSYHPDDIYELRDNGKKLSLEKNNGIAYAEFIFLGESRKKLQCTMVWAIYSKDGAYHKIEMTA